LFRRRTSVKRVGPESAADSPSARPPAKQVRAMADPLIRNISDTARWAALYRARETERPNPAYRDPFARRLAGEGGDEIARLMAFSEESTWAWVTRTVLFDQFVNEQVRGGVDMVVNLAAGLDA